MTGADPAGEPKLPNSRPLEGAWLPAHRRAEHDAESPAAEPLSAEVLQGRQLAVTDPEALFHHSGLRALQALSFNTFRAYRADWRTFVRFCAQHDYPALPASRATLEAFIEWRSPWNRELAVQGKYRWFAAEQPREPASASAVARALAAIAAIHLALRLPDPTADTEVRATLKIHSEWRKTQRQKRALRWEHVQAAVAALGDDLRGIRNKAMLALAYSTLLRRAELVAVELDDYVRDPASDTARLRISKTKAGVSQHATYRHVRAEAVVLLEDWIARAGIGSGPLFRGIGAAGRLSPRALDAGEVGRIFKRAAELIGEPTAHIGAHSTRIGAAQDLARYGAQLPEIMTEGGWKSPQMPAVYLREQEADTGAMARMAKAQARAVGVK